jgi:DNA polymerase-2
MTDGWLLDLEDGADGTSVTLWLKERGSGRVRSRSEPYRPPFLVDGPRDRLRALADRLTSHPSVDTIERPTLAPSLFDRRPRHVLAVTPRRNFERRRLATDVDAFGDYREFTLYDVDLTAPQLYCFERDLYPFAPVTWDARRVRAREPAETIEYALPPLRVAPLAVTLKDSGRGGLVAPDAGRLASVRLDDAVLEGEDERELLLALMRELVRQDPDVLLTEVGDAFDLPWLYRRAGANGLSPTEFFLGRASMPFRPVRAARSFETYGRIVHREASFPISGRFHLDGGNSFLYGDAGLEGLVDAARLSRLSLQTVARQSPGTCFTAMEMAQARRSGVRVPWKKNRPEAFKSARRLVEADRGGVIFLPPVGVHDRVEEFDFASLYPHIMVRRNLSTETLECRCCRETPHVAPGLGYRSCARRTGLIPRTLAPLLERRLAYKAAMKDPKRSPEERAAFARRVKMLKWILVTAFGYQGYRNARFGRIECHEAINAYARDLLARLIPRSETEGYAVVHGIVDSLWLVPKDRDRPPDPNAFAKRMSAEFDLPLGYEGRYRWIVFLPAVTHGFGVPNRYYGMYENGEFKLRGIGSRRHDTPVVFRRFEKEILELFSRASDAAGVHRALARALARADLFARTIAEGVWPREELLLEYRLSQAPNEYTTFTDRVAVLRQLAAAGFTKMPGESVRYLLVDHASRSWRDRVVLAERLAGDERYDTRAYLELLARAAELLLAPMGWTRSDFLMRWNVHGTPRAAHRRYRSAEAMRQLQLAR